MRGFNKWGGIIMIIIGFSDKTRKILPHICCGQMKHVAPIAVRGAELVLYQFVRRGHVQQIKLKMRDIKILGAYGWRFVYVPCALPQEFDTHGVWTCVQLTKRAIKMKNIWIQTPDALYNRIKI